MYTEIEESKRLLEDSQNTTLSEADSSLLNIDSMQPPATPATPDYAAGLTSLNSPAPVVIANNRSPIHTPSTPFSSSYFQSPSRQPRTPQTPLYTPVIMDTAGTWDEKSSKISFRLFIHLCFLLRSYKRRSYLYCKC